MGHKTNLLDSTFMRDTTILIRGAGEIASGVAHRLWRSGFPNIVMTEIEKPVAVRRKVSFSEAVFDGKAVVEKLQAIKVDNITELFLVWKNCKIGVVVDPTCRCLDELRPDIIVDAILAKKNLGTTKGLAELVIALGPGFEAGVNCDCLIETNRGHNLGRLITRGTTSINTGIPGSIMGQTYSRVLRAPRDGILRTNYQIGDKVIEGDIVAWVANTPIIAQTGGVLRGLLRTASQVTEYVKVGDIDPRSERSYCYTISDKARAIAGSVLEAILAHIHGTLT